MSVTKSVPVLRLSGIGVVREGVKILDRIEWTIQRGEHWVILGPNGSGKSSLLSVLGGYLTATEGFCELLGCRYGETDWRLLRGRIGIISSAIGAMVPEDEPSFCTVLTGRDGGIGLWANVNRKERMLALSWLRKVEAEHLADRAWGLLSLGEKQRVLIARSLINSPKLLVLDEPCAGLDPVAREGFLSFVERLINRKDAPSVTLVTHHVEEIVTGFTHALLMQSGCVVESGPLRSTLRTEHLQRTFGAPLKLRRFRDRYRLDVTVRGSGLL